MDDETPRHAQAMAMLMGTIGPLDVSVAFDPDVASAAYMAHLAWVYGRTGGILKGRPGYEAAELLGSRIRAASSRSGSFSEWGSNLLADVGVRLERLRPVDLLWWRGRCALVTSDNWRRLRQRHVLEEVVCAASLLREWLWEQKQAADAAKEA